MKRFPLTVECLEDRCVPAADAVLQTVAVAVPPPSVSYVIDPPLIDPNAPPAPQTAPPVNSTPPGLQSLPTDLILPIAIPFWY